MSVRQINGQMCFGKLFWWLRLRFDGSGESKLEAAVSHDKQTTSIKHIISCVVDYSPCRANPQGVLQTRNGKGLMTWTWAELLL